MFLLVDAQQQDPDDDASDTKPCIKVQSLFVEDLEEERCDQWVHACEGNYNVCPVF